VVQDLAADKERLKELIWAGKYFGRNEAFEVMDEIFPALARENLVAALSERSSLYYSAVGHCWKQKKRKPWLLLKMPSLHRSSVNDSDEMQAEAGGVEKLTANQLDVRQSILRRARRYDEALQCISEALNHERIAMHTEALLYIGFGEISRKLRRSNDEAAAYREAEGLLPKVVEQGQLAQAARIARHLSGFYKRRGKAGPAAEFFRLAQRYAEKAGAKDQIIKSS
jgi:tetratricopeptide (TPR) repeat protein